MSSRAITFKDLQIKSSINKIHPVIAAKAEEPCNWTKVIPKVTSKKRQTFIRKIPSRKKVEKVQYYDKLDKIILKEHERSMKVKWSEKEDFYLMLCKLGDMFLNPKKALKQTVFYNIVRDVVRRLCPEAKNKTSRQVKLLANNY